MDTLTNNQSFQVQHSKSLTDKFFSDGLNASGYEINSGLENLLLKTSPIYKYIQNFPKILLIVISTFIVSIIIVTMLTNANTYDSPSLQIIFDSVVIFSIVIGIFIYHKKLLYSDGQLKFTFKPTKGTNLYLLNIVTSNNMFVFHRNNQTIIFVKGKIINQTINNQAFGVTVFKTHNQSIRGWSFRVTFSNKKTHVYGKGSDLKYLFPGLLEVGKKFI